MLERVFKGTVLIESIQMLYIKNKNKKKWFCLADEVKKMIHIFILYTKLYTHLICVKH